MLSRLIERLARRWYIQCGVLSEESIRLEHDADTLHGHDGEILNAWVMGKTECWENVSYHRKKKKSSLTVPENQVLVLDCVIASSPDFDTIRLLALVCELARGEELVILILRDPNGTSGKASALIRE